MKVAQNDETNPNTQPVRPPHIPSIANTQLSPLFHLSENAKPGETFPDVIPLHKTDAALVIDYVDDDPSLPKQLGKPPL